ncbi:MAG: dihydrofolate reductase family protein [Ilumatobacteraceae bacterium]
MRRLHPEPTEDVSVAHAYRSPLGRHDDRPWVSLCMVASIDGSTATDGVSAGLSNPTDLGVLLQLRSIADVIIVGASTARAEGYGPPAGGQRVGVVTASGSIDFDSALFASGAGFVITTENSRFLVPDGIDVVRAGRDGVDLTGAIDRLPRLVERCQVVQAEGGSTLNGALIAADALDEMNITTSSMTVGGTGPRLASSTAAHGHRFDVAQVAIDDLSFVYTRWLRRRS